MSSTARRLAYGSALRVFDFLAAAVVSFFMMPFVVHSLGDRMYGFWTLLGAFIGYYGLLDLGLSSAVNRHIAGAIGAGDREQCNRIFSTALVLYTGLGLIAMLVTGVLAVLAPVICRNPDDASLFWKVIVILGVNTAIAFPLRVFGGILAAQLRYDITSIIQTGSLILRAALVVLILALGYKVLALAWVTLLSGIPGWILYVYFSKKNLPSLRFSRTYWGRGPAKVLFSYSLFSFIAQMADRLRFHVDTFVITAFVGLSAVTHYNIAALLVHYYIGFVIAFMGVVQPLFSRQHGAGDFEAIKKTFFFATKISICVSTFVGFGLIAWGKPFIHRWMGPQYVDAYPCLVLLAVGCLFALWQNPSVSLLFGTSKHRFYALFNSLEGAANLLLSLILVRKFGIVGVAFGTFFPMAVMKLAIQPLYVCRASSIAYAEYVRAVGKTMVAVGLSLVLPALASVLYLVPDYTALFGVGLASAACYCLALWVSAFTSREKADLRHALFARPSL